MKNATINVLLVDDDAEYVKVVERMLRRSNGATFHLIWKNSGETGIHELQSNHAIDIVLMDYFLPGSNGIDVVKKMAACNLSVPVIFLTTCKNFDVVVEAIRNDVADYLVKDEVTETSLPQSILSVLEHVRQQQHVTEMEKQQTITQKRAEAIKELIVTISHEINNPLAAIKISADIIGRQQLSDNERQLLNELLQKIALVENEVGALKDFEFRMEHGRKTIHKKDST